MVEGGGGWGWNPARKARKAVPAPCRGAGDKVLSLTQSHRQSGASEQHRPISFRGPGICNPCPMSYEGSSEKTGLCCTRKRRKAAPFASRRHLRAQPSFPRGARSAPRRRVSPHLIMHSISVPGLARPGHSGRGGTVAHLQTNESHSVNADYRQTREHNTAPPGVAPRHWQQQGWISGPGGRNGRWQRASARRR